MPAPTIVRKFLPEVQALRTLAVGLVVIYHLQPSVLPGGFIGVDVFFVLSGYLITGNMLRESERTGHLSLLRFWGARMRRILPAALATILAAALGSLVFMPSSAWRDISEQSLASAFYVQNWKLAADSVDYLAAENAATPLQHFWSLSVEEQFYVFWPLLVILAIAISARVGTPASARRASGSRLNLRAILIVLFGLATAASLITSIVMTYQPDPAAYFVTPTRIWELGLGGLLAVTLRYTEAHNLVRSFAALGGLAMIGVAAFVLTGSTPFPGVAAALPVVGTMLVVAAGRTRGWLSLHRITDLAPIQWVGNISYSLYLWHWPVIIFYKNWAEHDPGWRSTIGLLIISVGMAWLSYKFIETPFRHGRKGVRSWKPVLAGVLATTVIGAVSLAPLGASTWQERQREEATRALEDESLVGYGAASFDKRGSERAWASDNRVVTPDPNTIGDRAREPAGCHTGSKSTETKECSFGPEDADVTVAIVGDSHAAMWYPVVNHLAEQRGWRIVTYLHNSCPFNLERRVMETRGDTVCQEPNEKTFQSLVDNDVQLVFTAGLELNDFADTKTGQRPGVDGYNRAWKKLRDAGMGVVAFADTPHFDGLTMPRECVSKNYEDPVECEYPRKEVLADDQAITLAAARDPEVTLVDVRDRFCDDRVCPSVVGNVLVYRDQNHITEEYVRSMMPLLEEKIAPALP
ncbi:acyltransferase family protein [Propionibacteriaceae bacterium Y1700]|uniref:acyltransferase family protein n=1 Tax=Microlunatus sp. Y1700 TaxID=3418487 RepID=UPI003DA72F45